jgi:hypothetical protein
MSASHLYLVESSRLQTLAGTSEIFTELVGHLTDEDEEVKWPERFYALFDPGADDTEGLRFYTAPESEKPFWRMGYSDTGFYIVLALIRAAGTSTE